MILIGDWKGAESARDSSLTYSEEEAQYALQLHQKDGRPRILVYQRKGAVLSDVERELLERGFPCGELARGATRREEPSSRTVRLLGNSAARRRSRDAMDPSRGIHPFARAKNHSPTTRLNSAVGTKK